MLAALWMIIGALFGIACGFAAIPRNRSAVVWWFLGVLFGPVTLAVLLRQGERPGPRAIL